MRRWLLCQYTMELIILFCVLDFDNDEITFGVLYQDVNIVVLIIIHLLISLATKCFLYGYPFFQKNREKIPQYIKVSLNPEG